MTKDFDELRITSWISVPYEEYFSSMDLSKEEIKKRIDFAEDIEEIMLYIFLLLSTMQDYGYVNRDYVSSELEKQYLKATKKHVDIDEYIRSYILRFSKEIIDTTLRHKGDDWFLSRDRSVLIAENEAVSVYSHYDYTQAVKQGKTRKIWLTEHDDRVRKTHSEIDGLSIPIKELFRVGDSLMLYPKDETYNPDPQEVIGCRCVAKYY